MITLTILRRNIKWRFNNVFTIVITILQPILWLVLYSTIASSTMQNTGIDNYTAFILPGLMVLVCFGTCSSSGIMNYLMKTDGSFYRILIAPLNRSSIVLAQLLEAVLCSFFEVLIMVVISLLFFVKIPLTFTAICYLILLIFLSSFSMAGLCYGISLLLPNAVVYETLMNAIVLPVFFLSTALFPAENITGYFAVAVNLNPFTHVIDAIRSLILYGQIDNTQLLLVIVLFLILGILSFIWARFILIRETNA